MSKYSKWENPRNKQFVSSILRAVLSSVMELCAVRQGTWIIPLSSEYKLYVQYKKIF